MLQYHFAHINLGVIFAGLLLRGVAAVAIAVAATGTGIAAFGLLSGRCARCSRGVIIVLAALAGTSLLAIQIDDLTLCLAIMCPLRWCLLAGLIMSNRIRQYGLLLLVMRRLGQHWIILFINHLLAGIILTQAKVPSCEGFKHDELDESFTFHLCSYSPILVTAVTVRN